MLLYLNIEQDEALLKAGVNSGVQIGSWTPVLLYLTIDSNTHILILTTVHMFLNSATEATQFFYLSYFGMFNQSMSDTNKTEWSLNINIRQPIVAKYIQLNLSYETIPCNIEIWSRNHNPILSSFMTYRMYM
jgi:hypothetical protein